MSADPTVNSTVPGPHGATAVAAPSRAAELRARFAALEQVPGVPKPDPIVVADDVTRHFGGMTAVDVDHLEVERGAITALIGPNGAGKTTLFNLLTGFDKPSTGTWTFNGRSLSGTPAAKVARSGMVRTFQLTKALSRMTVIENMRLGATAQPGRTWRGRWCPVCGGPASGRSPSRRRSCWSGSSSTPNATTSPGACPGGSASCSRWRGR